MSKELIIYIYKKIITKLKHQLSENNLLDKSAEYLIAQQL